ncbi:MAG: aspartate aminotransferase family protein [Bacteroidales bacterium]
MNTHAHLFKRYIAQASEYPTFTVDVERAEGIYIWDTQGKKYIDFISSICVNNLGHRHPQILEAIHKQMDQYLHVMVYGEFIQGPQLALAQKLAELLPEQLQKIFFLNSGSEAIEGAIKLARLYNKRKEIIGFAKSYHGSTMGAMSVLGHDKIRDTFEPLLPCHKMLPYNSEADLNAITTQTCCVIAEVIQSGAGMVCAEQNFLTQLRKRCTEVGALLIFDEIQTGFGRTAKLFAFEHYGVVPDILCIAKGMGGGMPISAFISSVALMELLNNEHPLLGHASTFGGHPLSCVSSLKALELINTPEILGQVEAKGQRIRNHLKTHPQILEVRGKGLFLAVVFKDPTHIEQIVERCMANGFITLWLLFNHEVLALTPPLTITNQEIDMAMAIFKQSLDEAFRTYEKQK